MNSSRAPMINLERGNYGGWDDDEIRQQVEQFTGALPVVNLIRDATSPLSLYASVDFINWPGLSYRHNMTLINGLCDMLQVHSDRDKVVSLACYGLKLWGASSNRTNLLKASAALANARATLRLFDDAATLQAVWKYGLGKQDGIWAPLGVSGGLFTIAYLQAEKLMWLHDARILVLTKKQAYNLRTAHKLFWALYTLVGFIRSLRVLHIAAKNMRNVKRTKCAPARLEHATLTSTKLLLDFIHVVTWLPDGWLWGSKVQMTHAAALATASATLGLLTYFKGRRLQQR